MPSAGGELHPICAAVASGQHPLARVASDAIVAFLVAAVADPFVGACLHRVIERVVEAVKNALDANGISIPFPQLDLHVITPGQQKMAA